MAKSVSGLSSRSGSVSEKTVERVVHVSQSSEKPRAAFSMAWTFLEHASRFARCAWLKASTSSPALRRASFWASANRAP